MSSSSEPAGGGRLWVWLWSRRFSQVIFLSFFFYLFLRYHYQHDPLLRGPLHFFFRLDPLLLLAFLLSSWHWSFFFWPALVLVLLTILLGRFFCGWICPLGATLDGVGAILRSHGHSPSRRLSHGWRRLKYLLLVVLLVLALFHFAWVGLFDPLCLLFRSSTIAIYPAMAHVGEGFFDLAFRTAPEAWTEPLDSFYYLLKGSLLPRHALSYHLLLFTGGLFIAVFLLEMVEERFWCKNLCPLGALLGLLARWRRLKRLPGKLCSDCGDCRSICKMDSFAAANGRQNLRECILCLSCLARCREARVHYRLKSSTSPMPEMDLGRRRLVLSGLGALLSLPLLQVAGGSSRAGVLRPPGALPEPEFSSRCVRCGACMKVCITNGLQPLFLERGLAALWSPTLVARQGYCEYHCTLCGQACPTGAIRLLSPEEKERTVIGKAVVDPSRCIPYAQGKNCLVCQEHCPTSPKAIIMRTRTVLDLHLRPQRVKQPVVIKERCVGCGICENKCPLEGVKAGIRVRPLTPEERLG